MDNFTSRKICKWACRSLPSSSSDVEVYSFTFATQWSQNCQSWTFVQDYQPHNFSNNESYILKWHQRSACSSGAASYPGASWDFLSSRGTTGHFDGIKIRSAAFLFMLSLPFRSCVFVASYNPCVVSTVENLQKRLRTRQALERTSHSWRKAKQIRHTSSFSINHCKFSAQKDRKNVALIGR